MKEMKIVKWKVEDRKGNREASDGWQWRPAGKTEEYQVGMSLIEKY